MANTRLGNEVGRATLYRNESGGKFIRVTNAITSRAVNSFGSVWGDYDNDGDLDLYSANTDNVANDLYRNEGKGEFTLLAAGATGPLTTDRFNSWDVAWVDYNRDGLLDVFLANGSGQQDNLYANQGTGQFTRATAAEVGNLVADALNSVGCAWADFDHDGNPDVFVAHDNGPNTLFRNGDGRFESSLPFAGVLGSNSVSAAWADFDQDGWLDVFVAGGENSTNQLYRNLAGQGFENVADQVGVAFRAASMQGVWGDYDNDGDLDLFVLNRNSEFKNSFFLNLGGGRFSPLDVGSPIRDGIRDIGVGWADYDNDGYLDLLIVDGNGTSYPNHLYRNNLTATGVSNHFVKIMLKGSASNTSAIGARIDLMATIQGREHWQVREIAGGTAWSGGHGLVAHFGLGDASNVTRLRVEWPSGAITELTDLAVDQVHRVVEPTAIIPAKPVVSPGDDLTLTCRGSGAIQWYFNGEAISGATNRVLELSAITAEHAGRYTVVLSTATATNVYAACVRVDTQFTRITSGALVEDSGNSYIPVWGDYDGDGYVDLFVANGGNEGPTLQFIYRNNGDGTFSRMTAAEVGELANDKVQSAQGGWADIDNDGDLDLFIGSAQEHGACRLYLNQGHGQFAPVMEDVGVNQPLWPWGSVWADYDNDGWVDLYLGSGWVSVSFTDCLMRNQRDGTFRACSGIPFRLMNVNFGSWGDADNDGDLDLFVGDFGAVKNAFYRNKGDGTFIDDTAAGLCPGAGGAVAPVWGDYDNDGDLDLFLTRNGGPCYYYKNQGDGTFLASGRSRRYRPWGCVRPPGITTTTVTSICSSRGGRGAESAVYCSATMGRGILSPQPTVRSRWCRGISPAAPGSITTTTERSICSRPR